MVYKLANVAEYFLKQYSTLSIITPYLVVVGPRFLMCALSFLVDLILYKICVNNNEKYKNRLVVLASSYVVLVYGTRTFSNTFELVLFALLQYYVCESLVFSNTLIKKREYLNYRYERSRTVVEKAKFHKLRLLLTSDSLRNCVQISVITVLGFFNRPTFLAFAMFPVFFWLYRGLGNKLVAPMNYHLRILALIVCSIPTILLSVLIDSFYYGYITWGEVGVLHVTIDNFVFTPLNFILYNMDSGNLAEHGLHPRFLHVLVNMPLLFGLLALFAYYNFCQAVYNLVTGRHHLLPTVRSIKGLMMLSYLGPLTILSIFPHQEPRFLIPLILPLVYLSTNSVFPESDNILIKLEASTLKNRAPEMAKSPTTFLKLWLVVNLILVLFFGFLHQGGVYRSGEFLYKDMKRHSRTDFYVVTSHIYSMPKSLVLQKSSDVLHHTKRTKYTVNKRFFLYEKGSSDLDLVVKDLQILRGKLQDYRWNFKSKKYKLILIIPSSLEDRLSYSANSQFEFKLVTTFYPHISTEAFPDLGQDLFYFYSNLGEQDFYRSVLRCLIEFFHSFGLNLYEIEV
ncbi:GPI mannosyltransferase 4 isoform X2 [Tribolium castaneum]